MRGHAVQTVTVQGALIAVLLGLVVVFSAFSGDVLAGENTPGTASWTLPALTAKGLDGEEHDLCEWRGKVILLNFWASWCGPCMLEIPHLVRYQAVHGSEGLQVIAVGLDEQKKLRNVVRTLGIGYPVLAISPERHFEILKQWGNSYGILPYTVIIDRDGHVLLMQQGVFADQAFETYVLPLL